MPSDRENLTRLLARLQYENVHLREDLAHLRDSSEKWARLYERALVRIPTVTSTRDMRMD